MAAGDPPIEIPCIECKNLHECSSLLEQHCSQKDAFAQPLLLRQIVEYYQQGFLKYKHLFKNAPDAIFIANAETGIILEANDKAAELLGVPTDQIIGMHQTSLHPAEDAQKYKQIFEDRTRDKASSGDEETYVQHRDGRHVPVQIKASKIQIGGQWVLFGIFRDMTRQKQAEKTLKVTRERCQRLSDAAFEGIVFHEDGIFIESNQQFADMFGYSLDEIPGMDGYELYTPESREKVRQKIISGDNGPYQAVCQRKDGSTFPAEVQAGVVELQGKFCRVAAIRDLTKQKKLQQALDESEEKYRRLYKNAHAAIYRTRISDGVLLDCSRAAARLIGYENEEEFKSNFCVTDTYVDPSQREQFINTLKKEKRVRNFEIQIKRKDGTPIWVADSAEIFPEQDCIEGAMVDITIEKTLTKAETMVLRQLMQGKTNKQIAHELDRSVRTIEDHRSKLMHKLGVDNALDLAKIVITNDPDWKEK